MGESIDWLIDFKKKKLSYVTFYSYNVKLMFSGGGIWSSQRNYNDREKMSDNPSNQYLICERMWWFY